MGKGTNGYCQVNIADGYEGTAMSKKDFSEVAKQRLRAIELAEKLGNISEACRIVGINRTSFYEWQRRYQAHGLEGLNNLNPVYENKLRATDSEIIDRILQTSLMHPEWGCVRLSEYFKEEYQISVSSPTIQKYLIRNNMAGIYDRCALLEKKILDGEITPDSELLKQVEDRNPRFKERDGASSRPGEVLRQDVFCVGRLLNQKIYMHTIVDIYSSYAFGMLYSFKDPQYSVGILHAKALPFMKQHGFKVKEILTDDHSRYSNRWHNPLETYAAMNNITYRTTKDSRRKTNGFMVAFKRIAVKSFFHQALGSDNYDTLEELEHDFYLWLSDFNENQAINGFPNFGKTPLQMIEDAEKKRS